MEEMNLKTTGSATNHHSKCRGGGWGGGEHIMFVPSDEGLMRGLFP